MLPLNQAPLAGHPRQGRYDPFTGNTPNGTYGREPVVAYGRLPVGLLICEMKGPSAIAIAADGAIQWQRTDHLGRWIESDATRGHALIGKGGYRTIQRVGADGVTVSEWGQSDPALPDIYGVRVSPDGSRMVVCHAGSTPGPVIVHDLGPDGWPVGEGAAIPGYLGYARSVAFDDERCLVWIADTFGPETAPGCTGRVMGVDPITGVVAHEYPGAFPNDVEMTPGGDVVWVDEHMDRARRVCPETAAPFTIAAGSKAYADWNPLAQSESASALKRRHGVLDGSGLSSTAVEYAGLSGLYAPNGIAMIADDLAAIADTDDGRVIVVRFGDDWRPEVLAVVARLNEPTKVRLSPFAAT